MKPVALLHMLFGLWILTLSGISTAAPQTIKVGAYTFPPYFENSTGVIPRFLTLINQSQDRYRFVLIKTSARRRYIELEKGVFDMMLFENPKWGWDLNRIQAGKPLLSEAELYIARSATPQRLISVDLSVGSRLPAYCTSMGRILLAGLNDDALEDYLAHADLQVKTSRTVHTPEMLRASIAEIRQQGWVIIDQELEVGLRSIAVPLKDSAGQVLAALNVGTHAGRVSRQELETRFLPVLLEASRELGTRLFH